MKRIDLNCDMGESFGVWRMGEDVSVMPWITSANVACGYHAGDPRVMDRTVAMAAKLGVGVGAHPGFFDLVGFGRRNLEVTPDEAYTDVLYQIGALHAFCVRHGVVLQHVKPHGQLNNLALHDAALAEAIAQAVKTFRKDLILISYGGELTRKGREAGVPVAAEVYADRAYHADGSLVSRAVTGSVLHDAQTVVRRAVAMVVDGRVPTVDGADLPIEAATICVHGDTPGAPQLAQSIHEALSDAGVDIRPLRDIVAVRDQNA